MFEKTTGKNRPRIDLDVQHSWASVFGDFCSMHSKKEHGHRIKEQECVQECLSVVNLDFVALSKNLNNPSELSLIKVYFTCLISLDGMSEY